MATQNEKTSLATTSSQQQESSSQPALFRQSLIEDSPFLLSELTPREFFRLNPFSLMRRITDDLDRVVREAGLTRTDGKKTVWSPAIEVTQSDGTYRIQADLPGLSPQDVKVDISEGEVAIQGERRHEHQETKEGVHRSEREFGVFYRRIPLPEGAEIDQAKASFRNGVLEITVPVRQQQTEHRYVPIETDSQSRSDQQNAA
jgi:HSP20 family protein